MFQGNFIKNNDYQSKQEEYSIKFGVASEIFTITNRFSQDLEYDFFGDTEYFGLEILENSSFKQILPCPITNTILTNSTGYLIILPFSTSTFRISPLIDALLSRSELIKKVSSR
jgi:hypothetical protein